MLTERTYRRRRRLRLWIPLLLVVVAVVVFAAGGVRSSTRDQVAYFDAARAIAEEQALIADAFRALVGQELTTVERGFLVESLQQLRTVTDEQTAALAAEELPGSAAGAGAAFSLASDAWDDGLAAFEKALFRGIDDPEDELAVADLAGALAELSVGDRLYRRFTEILDDVREDVDVDIGQFPEVRYLEEGDPVATSAELIMQRARNSELLALRRDMEITQVRFFDPEETGGERGGRRVIEATDTVSVQISITNAGNQSESGLAVTSVLENGDGVVLEQRRDTITELGPDMSTAVDVLELAVEPGTNYSLLVTVSASPDEANPDNNRAEILFRVNDPT